jgi:predicted  nucleic acid-binding Zn-ribbon protein
MELLQELEKRIDHALTEIAKVRAEKEELKKLVKDLEHQNHELREKAAQAQGLSEAVENSQAQLDGAARQIEQIILKLDKAF